MPKYLPYVYSVEWLVFLGANFRIGLGFIGTGLIAEGHLASFPGLKEIQPIAVCDVREKAIRVR